MSLQTDGVWKGGIWSAGVWADGVWFEAGGPSPSPAPAPSPAVQPSGGYALPYDRREAEERVEQQRLELKRIDDEIAEAERQKMAAQKRAKAKLLAIDAAERLAAMERRLQEEISALRIERMRLMRRIDDEEAILIILLSSPFH